MSKKKEMVRINVARDETQDQVYLISFGLIKPLEYPGRNPGSPRHWQGPGLWKETSIHPEMFEQIFDFHLDPGQGPVLVEFPKIVMKAVK